MSAAPVGSWLAAQPAASALALPAHAYVGARAAARDRGAVLACGWQLLARASQRRLGSASPVPPTRAQRTHRC